MSWQEHSVSLNSDVSLTLGELVDGWQAQVRRFVAELKTPPADYDAWGAHDYIGALHLRDAVERGIAALPETVRADAIHQLSVVDRDFEEYTEPDRNGRLGTFMTTEQINDGWWWRRVPVRGPVRHEID